MSQYIGEILQIRVSRRRVLASGARGALVATSAPLLSVLGCTTVDQVSANNKFEELPVTADETDHVAAGYRADVVLSWGDALHKGMTAFDPTKLTADEQERRFGYNNDYIGVVVLPELGKTERMLLCVNHEFPIGSLMFAEVKSLDDMTAELCDIEQASVGVSIVEVHRLQNRWSVCIDSKYNRRITLRSTPIDLCGPARGHPRLITDSDPSGTTVIGTMRNCAGGVTPWNTYLSSEENINTVFFGAVPEGHTEQQNNIRMGMPRIEQIWGKFDAHFDLSKTPNEPNRFGWVVEIDPLDPLSRPKKRTSLGRFMHEGAEPVVAPDGRIVVYMGDDSEFEYVYKFVTTGPWDPADPDKNKDILDDGILYVAKFHPDGFVDWLPIVHGQGPLTAQNGFESLADVLIETRRAADLLGATPMDRPEGVKPNSKTGRVYIVCTKNPSRKDSGVANSRTNNQYGHIIELVEPLGDFAATRSRWEVLIHCAPPEVADENGAWHTDTTSDGWFANPDNVAIDRLNRLWVATDQGRDWPQTGRADGIWMVETEGPNRALPTHFYNGPIGAEITGPQFDAGETSLFVSIQHPAFDGTEGFRNRNRPSTFADPATRWPDFDDQMPPRPSVVAITHESGELIGAAARPKHR